MEGVKNIYDKTYKEYGKNLPNIWLWPNELENFYLKNIIKKIKPKLILDAGCGVGLKLINLRNYNVFGFDYSFEGLKICKVDGFRIFQASVHKIPIKDETFDFIFSFQVIQHLLDWDHIKTAFKEISRILKRGGYFLSTNYRLYGKLEKRYLPVIENGNILHRWAFTIEDYEKLSKEANLELVKVGTILNIKPKGVGKFPFLKSIYKFIDYQLFNLGYSKGKYLVGLFKKV